MSSTPITPRRSRRFQPLVYNVATSTPETTVTWDGAPIHVRSSAPEDLAGADDDDDTRVESSSSAFYRAFRRGGAGSKALRTYGKAKGKAREIETFAVGDTVFVRTAARTPSVAVIIAMWGVTKDFKQSGDEDEDEGGDAGTDTEQKFVKVHWFLRPSELPQVRAKRDHLENEIYYTLAATAIIVPSQVLDHCIVTSASSAPQAGPAPSSSQTSRSRGWVYAPSTTGVDDSATCPFICLLALHSPKGLYFSFDWDEHHAGAISAANGQQEGEQDHDWDPCACWDVDADLSEGVDARGGRTPAKRVTLKDPSSDEDSCRGDADVPPETPSKRGPRKPSARKSAVAQTSPRKKRRTGHAPTDESESGGEGSGEEFALPPASSAGSSSSSSAASSDGDASSSDDDSAASDIEPVQRTPSRKRGRGHVKATPRKTPAKTKKRVPTRAAPTPHSKAALRKRMRRAVSTGTGLQRSPTKLRALAVRPPAPGGLSVRAGGGASFARVARDPWLRAMHALHVGARPDQLPCREAEYDRVLRAVEELLEEGSGGCVYISGVPGTGKTATVHAVVRELKRMAESNETSPFTYVEINGLRVPEPAAAYSLLWEAVSGHDVSVEGHLKIGTKEALRRLSRHFGSGPAAGARAGPGGHACVVLMDELDQLVTAKQEVVYNFFNWPTLAASRLVVVAVANTMDLPERVMSGRVRSRLGMVRINFQPYTTPQLEQIVRARLHAAKESLQDDGEASESPKDVIAPDGVKFAAMKVASISGDARRVLDICRRTVELVQPLKRTARTDDVKSVIKVLQNSPTAAFLRDCSLHERVMLAALLKCVRREGVEEIRWGAVQRQHLVYAGTLVSADEPSRTPTTEELAYVLESLLASRAVLVEEGAAVARRAEEDRRCVLNLEQVEVERVLGEVGGPKWRSALSA